MAANFKVSGELTLNAGGFVAQAGQAKTALQGVAQAGKELATTNQQLASSSSTVTQTAAGQAAAFAKLADATAAATAKKVSQDFMASVANSTGSLQQLYTGAATLKKANDDVGDSIEKVGTKLTAFQKTQLSFQLNDVFTQLASGQGVIRTAVQQGPQITQIFGGISATLARIPVAATAAAVGIGLVVGGVAALLIHGDSLLAQQRTIDNALQATGRAAGITAQQLQQVVTAEAGRAGAGRDQTQQAALQLLSNSAITGANIQATLGLARDLARITGQDLPTAASALSSGLDGTLAGAQKLNATFNALTPAELEQIKNFEQVGDKQKAVSVVIAALQRDLAGANERGISPLAKGVNDLSAALGRLYDRASNSSVLGYLGKVYGAGFSFMGKGVAAVTPGDTSLPPTADVLAAQRSSLESAKKDLADQVAAAKQLSGDAAAEAYNRISVAETRIASQEAKVQDLERRAADAAGKTVGDSWNSYATELKNSVNDAVTIVNQANTVEAQRQALVGREKQLKEALGSGLLTPSQTTQFQQELTRIQGALVALRTPAEEFQRQLNQDTKLSQLPAHLQAAQRAFDDTKRKALEMGDSEAQAEAKANQARTSVLTTQATATGQQVQLLSDEATAALKVAAAYDTSRIAALRSAAELKAQSEERQGNIAAGTAGTVAQTTLEETAGGAVQQAAANSEAYARQVAALNRLVLAEGQGAAAAREAERANKAAELAEDLRAQAAATNNATIIAAAEQQISKYDALTKAETAANVRRDAQALNRQYDPQSGYDYEISRLNELKATGLLTARTVQEAFKDADLKRLQSSRDATDGMVGALRQYADDATNAGKTAADGVKSALTSIEDVGVAVATGTSLSFTNMANSIIADLARIAIRQTITGPLAQGISSALPSFFSWLGGGSSTVPTVGPGTGYTYHQGGLRSEGTNPRELPAWVWAAAPRYHTGGIPGLAANEVPAILTDDEEVLTRNDPRHRWNLGGSSSGAGDSGGGGVVVYVNNPVQGTKATAKTTKMPGGGMQVDILYEQVESKLADRMAQGKGDLFKATGTVFGLNQAPRR